MALTGKAKVRNVERCGLCNEVTAGYDLVAYDGVCWYCHLDTATDEATEYIRQKGLFRERQGKELERRRAKRAALWGA